MPALVNKASEIVTVSGSFTLQEYLHKIPGKNYTFERIFNAYKGENEGALTD
jgi:hypothetical protein